MKKRLRWLVLGLLLAGAVYAVVTTDLRESAPMPPDVQDGIGDQLRLHYAQENVRLALELEEMSSLVDRWGERYADQVRLTQKWRMKAEGVPLTVPGPERVVQGEPVFVEGDCKITDPVMDVEVAGEQVEVGGRPGLRIRWKSEVILQLWSGEVHRPLTLQTDWQDGDVIEFDVAKPPPPVKPRHFGIHAGVTTVPGVRLGASYYKRGHRLGYWASVDWGFPESVTDPSNEFFYALERWSAAGGVAMRFGK
jgi:hypothetical protein